MILALRDYDSLTTYFVVVEWAALIFAVGAVFVLRRKMAEAPRPFRTPAYPWVPLFFVLRHRRWCVGHRLGRDSGWQLFADLRPGHCGGGIPRSSPLEATQEELMRNAILTDKAPKPRRPVLAGNHRGRFHLRRRTRMHQSARPGSGSGRRALGDETDV